MQGIYARLATERKSSFQIALICNARRRIPASASTNQGPKKDDLGDKTCIGK